MIGSFRLETAAYLTCAAPLKAARTCWSAVTPCSPNTLSLHSPTALTNPSVDDSLYPDLERNMIIVANWRASGRSTNPASLQYVLYCSTMLPYVLIVDGTKCRLMKASNSDVLSSRKTSCAHVDISTRLVSPARCIRAMLIMTSVASVCTSSATKTLSNSVI